MEDVSDLHPQGTEGTLRARKGGISPHTVLDDHVEAAHFETALNRNERRWSRWADRSRNAYSSVVGDSARSSNTIAIVDPARCR